MKPIINQEACIGCGTCESLCPAVFKINDEGKAEVLEADFQANQDCIKESVDACPVQVIRIEE